MSDTVKYFLPEDRIPKTWYNIMADLPEPPVPVLHPATRNPIGPDDLAPLFSMALIGQEVTTEREVEIPTPVRDVLKLWRPSPLYRARRLEQALDTPAHIYYKYEGVSPSGSHKPNTAVAQAEGIVPAPESTHAVKQTIDEALKCKEEGIRKTILFGLSGHGHFDMQAYTDFLDGKLVDHAHDNVELERALGELPPVAAE